MKYLSRGTTIFVSSGWLLDREGRKGMGFVVRVRMLGLVVWDLWDLWSWLFAGELGVWKVLVWF